MNNIRPGDLKEVFAALELAFKATGTDFYVIGAMAKDVWFSRQNLVTRQTKDVDILSSTSSFNVLSLNH